MCVNAPRIRNPVGLEVGLVLDRGDGLGRPGPDHRLERVPARRGAEGVKAVQEAGAGLAGRARGPLLTGASRAETETRPRPRAGVRGGGEAAWRGRGGPGGRTEPEGRAEPEPRRGGEGGAGPRGSGTRRCWRSA